MVAIGAAGSSKNLVTVEETDEFESGDTERDWSDLRQRADAAALFLRTHEFLFITHWMPVIELTWAYTKQAWERGGEPENLDGTPNYNSKPLQKGFRELLTRNHPSWAGWWMEPGHKELRHVCRHIGENQSAIVSWYHNLPKEKQAECNYPATVWREYKRANRPPPSDKKQPQHDEDIHELEEQHAKTVGALHEANAELKATNSELKALAGELIGFVNDLRDVEKLAQSYIRRGPDAVREGIRFHGEVVKILKAWLAEQSS